ncbi:MAG: sulfite exporter TauE/SafE family protein [Acidobacteria bacterium]|nr:sulfite exporter TauE/SafE family protein [Acidobacteriota bacterium]
MIEGFLLGLSTGTSCLAFCAPVLLPYFVAEAHSHKRNLGALGIFLLGRLTGYLIFAVLAWAVGWLLLQPSADREIIFGAARLVLALLLIGYGFGLFHPACAVAADTSRGNRFQRRWGVPLPLWLGLLTGLSLCPPFLLALTETAQSPSLGHSLLFFLAFFAGTSLFLLPLPLAGVFRRIAVLRPVARLTAGVIGCYYLYLGLLMITEGGMHS